MSHFDLPQLCVSRSIAFGEDGRPALGAEMPSVAILGQSRHADGVGRKDRSGVKHRPVVFAAIQTVTDADAVRLARGNDPDCSAATSALDAFNHV